MIDIEKPKIEIAEISDDNRYGKFICEPLERGYGTTFGNSLRPRWKAPPSRPSASKECSTSSPRSRACATMSRTSC